MKIPILKNKQAFQAVRRYGRSSRDASMILQGWHFDPSGTSESAFGWIVSKHFGHAVARNRMKRLFRAVIAHQWDSLPLSHGWHWVFIPKEPLKLISFQALVALIRKHCLFLIAHIPQAAKI